MNKIIILLSLLFLSFDCFSQSKDFECVDTIYMQCRTKSVEGIVVCSAVMDDWGKVERVIVDTSKSTLTESPWLSLVEEQIMDADLQKLSHGVLCPEYNVVYFVDQTPDSPPLFNGGDVNEFWHWVKKHLQYPNEDKGAGRLVLRFTITKEGELTNIIVFRGIHHKLNEEGIRAVSMSPRWSPATRNGMPVDCAIIFPIDF